METYIVKTVEILSFIHNSELEWCAAIIIVTLSAFYTPIEHARRVRTHTPRLRLTEHGILTLNCFLKKKNCSYYFWFSLICCCSIKVPLNILFCFRSQVLVLAIVRVSNFRKSSSDSFEIYSPVLTKATSCIFSVILINHYL